MKTLIPIFVLTFTFVSNALADNPVITDVFTADPAPLVVGDTVYLYVGQDEAKPNEHYRMFRWLCFSSKDMVNWKPEGSPLKPTDFKWAIGDAWASQVIEHNGKFYFYATVQHDESHHGKAIGVAVSDSPTGPFKDARGSALVTNDMTKATRISWDDIDPTVWIDDDGQAWLFWGNQKCYYAKLKTNMTELDGEIMVIPDEQVKGFTEAPWIHKRNDTFYLSYATGFPEKTAYSTAETITGPWTHRGLLAEIAGNSNTIHQGIITFKGKDYFVYHNGGIQPPNIGGSFRRSVCIDYLYYNPDGTMQRVLQTTEGIEPAVSEDDASAAKDRELKPLTTIDISAAGPGSRMWLGDLTGDGRYEFVMAQPDGGFDDRYIPHSVNALTAYDLQGNQLWQVGTPSEQAKSGSDIPCQLYDFDNDGQLEVLVAMDDQIKVFDGKTGKLESTIPLPDENAHDCILIANLAGDDHADELIVKDRYHKLWALDREGNVLFTFEGNLGHYGWAYDLDGDGKDELIFGYHVLNADGSERWRMDLNGHADAIWVADVDANPDNGMEILVGGDGSYLYNRDGKQIWAYEGTVESQNAFPGDFRPDLPGLEVGGLDRIDRGNPGLDGLFLIDAQGNELYKEQRPVPGWSSIATIVRHFTPEDQDLFLAYRRGGDLEPGLYDGHMRRLYHFPKELLWAHFMWADMFGTGSSQVIAYTDGGIAQLFTTDQSLKVEETPGTARPQPKRLYNWTRYWGSQTDPTPN